MTDKSDRAYYGELGKQDYGTPHDLYQRLNEEFCFSLDAAATWENALHPCYIAPRLATDEDVRRWTELVRPEGNAIPEHQVRPDLFPWPTGTDCLSTDWRQAIHSYDAAHGVAPLGSAATSVYVNPPYGVRIVRPTARHPEVFAGTGAFIHRCWQQAVTNNLRVVALLPAKLDAAWFDICMKAYEIRRIKGRVPFTGAENVPSFPSVVVIWLPVIFPRGHNPLFTTMDLGYTKHTKDDDA